MNAWIKFALSAGALTFAIGLVGLLLMRFSYDDGALVIAGVVVFSAGVIADTIRKNRSIEKD